MSLEAEILFFDAYLRSLVWVGFKKPITQCRLIMGNNRQQMSLNREDADDPTARIEEASHKSRVALRRSRSRPCPDQLPDEEYAGDYLGCDHAL